MHSAVNHSTPLSGVDAVSIVSDRSFPRHSHDEFGIGIMETGGQYSWSGRGSVEACVGDVMTVNPNEIHDGLGIEGEARGWRMLYFTPDALSALADLPPNCMEIENPVIRCPRARQSVRLAINALIEPFADDVSYEERLLVAAREILRPHRNENVRKCSSLSKPIQQVLAKIEAELDRPLSLRDFAITTGLSRFQILRHFTNEIGTTPHSFLMQLRVKRAKKAIVEGQSLAEAAVSVGFADQSHMTRAFSRQFGTTPGRYLTARNSSFCNILQS